MGAVWAKGKCRSTRAIGKTYERTSSEQNSQRATQPVRLSTMPNLQSGISSGDSRTRRSRQQVVMEDVAFVALRWSFVHRSRVVSMSASEQVATVDKLPVQQKVRFSRRRPFFYLSLIVV